MQTKQKLTRFVCTRSVAYIHFGREPDYNVKIAVLYIQRKIH